MNRAIYGRMQLGRCLQKESHELHLINGKDPRFIGCSTDVLPILDRRCSGRHMCDVLGSDAELQKDQPCHHGLNLYLEANFECLTGWCSYLQDN